MRAEPLPRCRSCQSGGRTLRNLLLSQVSHSQAISTEDLAKVEAIVNKEIAACLDVNTEEMGIEDVKKTGAMALFGEKYGSVVRVVSMGKGESGNTP